MIEIQKKYIHIYRALLILLTLIVFYASTRLLIYFLNPEAFGFSEDKNVLYHFFYGIRFDISALAYMNSVFFVLYFLPLNIRNSKAYKITLITLFMLTNSIAFLANSADAIYFRYIFKRSTWDIFNTIGAVGDGTANLFLKFFIDFWYMFVIWIILVYTFFIISKKILDFKFDKISTFKQYLYNIMFFLIVITLIVNGMRGGFQIKPIGLIKAGSITNNSINTTLILNSPFSIIRTYGKTGITEKHFFDSDKKSLEHYSPFHQYLKTDIISPRLNPNIVLIILESFSNEHLNSLQNNTTIGEGKNFAPFLDSLIHEGLFFTNAFANGKRSSEAIPAIISSVPTLMHEPFINSQYININYHSLPNLLKPLGYKSLFFHGGNNGTMNFDNYANAAGFDCYHGRREYNNDKDYDGNWGIWDEEFLQYSSNILEQTAQPFFGVILTLTSHHPYKVPEKYQNILPEGPLPIHKAIAYVDLSLKNFFETSKKTGWYKNTLFIITSDHTSEPYINFYKNSVGCYSIPLLFYSGYDSLSNIINKTCQHIDIMPSILNYIGYDKSFSAYGNSVFDTSKINFNIIFHNEIFQIILDTYAIQISDDKPVALYNIKTDSLLANNLINEKNYENQVKKIMNIYKSIIQNYNNRLINNTLVL